jgi:hypothetical protein
MQFKKNVFLVTVIRKLHLRKNAAVVEVWLGGQT